MMKIMTTLSAVAFMAGSVYAADNVSLNSGGPAAAVNVEGYQVDGSPDQWGTTSNSSVTYVAQAYNPVDSAITYAFAVLGAPANNICLFRNNAAGNPWVEAPIHLPNGALIQSIEYRFCDTNAAAAFTTFLTINSKTVAVQQPVMVSSTAAETPGCINRTFVIAAPILVDNNDKAYSLEINLGANTNTIAVCHARVYYRLQVSPAPAVATFPNDVPTSHPLFRFVEAMAASGLTGGCGPQVFCPDQAITRGQFSVFLASALGLHFPN
jgi:hypothetical protein